jgi:FKBP-type peptidyl-prolyl cis-trans isomerase 2
MAVKNGDKVKIQYEGKLEDGTIFDSSEKHGQALEFTLGQGQVIPGFENSVLGMEKGEEKEITIESKNAYGERKEELLKKVPKEQLPENLTPEVGMILGLQTPDGRQIPAPIVEVSEKEITIDLNHPLAGKNLKFKIKLTEIQESSNQKA